ncbi:MAG: hypothetical protein EA369_05715 [Bradymonadales bacterium]|nr:MAG: hypothetical protein EA369_05715 [Bradymonadales bacterium]
MLKSVGILFLLVGSFAMLSCQEKRQDPSELPRATQEEPRRVRVQHLLIGVSGSLPNERVSRTQAEAEELARSLYERAKAKPSEFSNLVQQYSDDQVPGVYELANFGVSLQGNEFPRGQMVSGFASLAFRLRVGEIGFLEYHPRRSPYGYHILMRLPD